MTTERRKATAELPPLIGNIYSTRRSPGPVPESLALTLTRWDGEVDHAFGSGSNDHTTHRNWIKGADSSYTVKHAEQILHKARKIDSETLVKSLRSRLVLHRHDHWPPLTKR